VKCCEGEEGDDGDRKQVYTYFGKKKVRETLSRLSDNESKLATNKTLGYDMLRVKLNNMMYCSFLD